MHLEIPQENILQEKISKGLPMVKKKTVTTKKDNTYWQESFQAQKNTASIDTAACHIAKQLQLWSTCRLRWSGMALRCFSPFPFGPTGKVQGYAQC